MPRRLDPAVRQPRRSEAAAQAGVARSAGVGLAAGRGAVLMPIYVLGPRNKSVRIPNQALTISISGTVQGASLVLHAADDQPTMQPNSHLAVLPRVNGPVSISVLPAGGVDRFAAGTQVSLAIGHDA